MIVLVFEMSHQPPPKGSKTQQQTSRQKIRTRDDTDNSRCGDDIEHGSLQLKAVEIVYESPYIRNSAIYYALAAVFSSTVERNLSC
jgi:hypothetical protein